MTCWRLTTSRIWHVTFWWRFGQLGRKCLQHVRAQRFCEGFTYIISYILFKCQASLADSRWLWIPMHRNFVGNWGFCSRNSCHHFLYQIFEVINWRLTVCIFELILRTRRRSGFFFKKSFPARVFEKETFVDGLGLFLYFIFHHLTPHLEILLPLFFQAFKEGAAASTTTAAAAPPPPEKKGGPPKKTDDRQTEAIWKS